MAFEYHSYMGLIIGYRNTEQGISDLTIPNGLIFGGQSNGPTLQEYNPFKRGETYTYGTDTDGDDVGDTDTAYLWHSDPTDETSTNNYGYQEVSTNDIVYDPEEGTITFSQSGNYFFCANFSLEPFSTGGAVADVFSSFEQDTPIIRFRINGELVWEHRQAHILTQTSGDNGQDFPMLAQFIFAVSAGDVLTVTVFPDDMDDPEFGSTDRARSRPLSIYMGSNLSIIKLHDIFANVRYDTDADEQSGHTATGIELYKSSVGGTVTSYTDGMTYNASTGHITPSSDARKMFLASTVRVSSSSPDELRIHVSGTDTGDVSVIGTNFGLHADYDPVTHTVAVARQIDSTGSIRTFLTGTTNAVSVLESGSSFSAFSIGSATKNPSSYLGYRIFGPGDDDEDTDYSDDATSTLNFSANAFYTASYTNFTGEFTLPATGLSFADPTTEHPQTGRVTINESGDYFIFLHMPINFVGTGADNTSGPAFFLRRPTGSISEGTTSGAGWWTGWAAQHPMNNFSTSLNDPADYNLTGIFRLEKGDLITFGFAGLNGRFKPGVNITMWKLNFLDEAKFQFAPVASDSYDVIGNIGKEKDAGTDVGSLDHSKQHYRTVEQGPIVLGVNGPPSIRGRVVSSLPFRVAGPKGGKK